MQPSPTLRFVRATTCSKDPTPLLTSLAFPLPHCLHLCHPWHPRPQAAPPARQPRLSSPQPGEVTVRKHLTLLDPPRAVAGRHLLANRCGLLQRRQPQLLLHHGPRLQELPERLASHHQRRPRWRPYHYRRLRPRSCSHGSTYQRPNHPRDPCRRLYLSHHHRRPRWRPYHPRRLRRRSCSHGSKHQRPNHHRDPCSRLYHSHPERRWLRPCRSQRRRRRRPHGWRRRNSLLW